MPICGHATIAAHYVYAKKNGIFDGVVIQKTKAGILPVEVISEQDDLRIIMTQAKIEFGSVISGLEKIKLLEGLKITSNELDIELPIQIVSTGHSKVMVPIKNKQILYSINIESSKLCDLSNKIKCNGFYVFTFDSQEKNVLISGRMFAPIIGINEDPVTGNANGPLGAYLTHYGKIEKERMGMNLTLNRVRL